MIGLLLPGKGGGGGEGVMMMAPGLLLEGFGKQHQLEDVNIGFFWSL